MGEYRSARYRDYPLETIVDRANEFIADGCVTYQKFTCAGCGARLTTDEPNTFFEAGTCDRCHSVTNLRKNGCNLMIVWSVPPKRSLA